MRTLRITATGALLLGALACGGAPSASASTGCASADVSPATASSVTLANAAVCLVNQERTSRGLRPLRVNKRLSKAARRHAQDMVTRDYFAHDTAGGGNFVDRIENAGY